MCRSVVASRVPEALTLRIFLKPKKLSTEFSKKIRKLQKKGKIIKRTTYRKL